jgi:hypothetical protein
VEVEMSCETPEPKPVDDQILVKRQDLENILYCLTAEDALADGIRIVKWYLYLAPSVNDVPVSDTD